MKTVFASSLISLFVLAFLIGYNFPIGTETDRKVEYSMQSFTPGSKLPDFSKYSDVNQKKNDFFTYLLPRVKQANDNILKERRSLLAMLANLPNLNNDELDKLQNLKQKYEVEIDDASQAINELLKRVDIIPASLALAQAANESAWGTSRFARKGNNLFGQWCYVKGCGIVPKQREGHEKHEVAKFDDVQGSIESYMRNLNSQASYEKLRELRQQAREEEQTITGIKLANGLWSYSTRREAYIHEIQAMIRFNNLQQFNRSIAESK